MGKILAACLIGLACLVGTGLAETQAGNRLSGFLSGSEIPEELQEGKTYVFFGADWCVWCPAQKAVLRTLEEKGCKVTYFDAEKDVVLYNQLRGTERRVPLTLLMVDGKIKKRFVGVHNVWRLKKAYDEEE